jgi:hypothetical protein
MAGPRRRLFTMNIGRAAVVCLLNPFSRLLDREGNRRENVDTAPGRLTMRKVSVSSCIRWAYGVQASQDSDLKRYLERNFITGCE